MSDTTSLRASLTADLNVLRDAADTLWDTDTHPDTVAALARMAQGLRTGVDATNISAALDFFHMMGQQDHLPQDLRQRADGAFFLASFCLTNADVVADDLAGA